MTSSPRSPSETARCERLEHLADVLLFVEMKRAWRLPALEAHRSDLGESVVIDHAGAPPLLDPLARGWDAAAGLSRDDQRANRARGEVGAAALGGDLEQPQRVGRRATDDGRAQRVDQREPGLARHAARRDAVGAQLAAGFECRPETEERTEGKRKENAIARADVRPRRPPSSIRASTASFRWCRAISAARPSSTTSGCSGCNSRAVR